MDAVASHRWRLALECERNPRSADVGLDGEQLKGIHIDRHGFDGFGRSDPYKTTCPLPRGDDAESDVHGLDGAHHDGLQGVSTHAPNGMLVDEPCPTRRDELLGVGRELQRQTEHQLEVGIRKRSSKFATLDGLPSKLILVAQHALHGPDRSVGQPPGPRLGGQVQA